MNINDPAGVKALLDQLRASQAWKEIAVPTATLSTEALSPLPNDSSTSSSSQYDTNDVVSPSRDSVASLLSKLQTSSSDLVGTNNPIALSDHWGIREDHQYLAEEQPSYAVPSQSSMHDTKSMTFQQALPYLAQLSDNPSFISAITQMKEEQDRLEKQLWEDRGDIRKKYEEKVKVAQTKAQMIGTRISQHEADMLKDAYKKELQKFDRDRVLPAWDGIVQKHQSTLAQLNVPTMFSTQDPLILERQHRVVKVLEGFIEGS